MLAGFGLQPDPRTRLPIPLVRSSSPGPRVPHSLLGLWSLFPQTLQMERHLMGARVVSPSISGGHRHNCGAAVESFAPLPALGGSTPWPRIGGGRLGLTLSLNCLPLWSWLCQPHSSVPEPQVGPRTTLIDPPGHTVPSFTRTDTPTAKELSLGALPAAPRLCLHPDRGEPRPDRRPLPGLGTAGSGPASLERRHSPSPLFLLMTLPMWAVRCGTASLGVVAETLPRRPP